MIAFADLLPPMKTLRPPRRGRAGLFRRAPKKEVVVKRKAPARIEAAAWFAIAAAILAWPRDPPAAGAVLDPTAPPRPFWRRLLDNLVGAIPQSPDAEVRSVAAREPGRGREARWPTEIPPAGWKDILWRTWNEVNKDRVTAVAGGVTFFGLLALFPALAAFVSLYGLFFDVASVGDQLRLLAGVLPRDALAFVSDQMVRLAAQKSGGLGLAFAISLGLSIWSANAGMKALIDGLNIAYEERERRGLIRLNLISLAFTAGALVFVIALIGVVVAAPVVLGYVGYHGGAGLFAILRWPVLLVVSVLLLVFLYRFGPSREHPRWRWVSWGGVAAAVIWLVASMAFSWYVANFGHYDRTYGSLGAAVGFMTWLWISTTVVLIGAELNSEIEHQTAVDSTTGPPEPMGRRGARMADTLGESAGAAKAKAGDSKARDPRVERARARHTAKPVR